MAFADLSLKDIWDGAIEVEKAKYDTRLNGTTDAQKNISSPTYPQNVGATQSPQSFVAGKGVSALQIGLGVSALLVVGFFALKKGKK